MDKIISYVRLLIEDSFLSGYTSGSGCSYGKPEAMRAYRYHSFDQEGLKQLLKELQAENNKERDNHIAELEQELTLTRGAMFAQDEREQNAAAAVGMSWTCDWPQDVADELLSLRQVLSELKTAVGPVVEWWQREKKINARSGDVLYVLAHIRRGVVMTQVTPGQLDALVAAVEGE